MTNTPAFPCRDLRLPVPERTEAEIRQELIDLGFDVALPSATYRGAERCIWTGAGARVQELREYPRIPAPPIRP